ncbi:hypothetical protein C8F04DRAFT_1062556 [Mycena alexandri]|uniref:Ankyrin n=1 Tax=Mycena alexandri TaxID=1745969 RepID=A0AAD6XEH6_9AGAR|nr:hypothetical protein C8F04DRAFT_1062556 [Mycena alexandri]
MVRLLLDKGANINLPGGDYGSPLGSACYGGKMEAVHFLLENGADIKTHGSSALKAAKRGWGMEKERSEVIDLLKDKGAVGPDKDEDEPDEEDS